MSFELYVFRGHVEDDEDGWQPLPIERASDFIATLPGIEVEDDEAYWPLGAHSVQFFLGSERSVGASISFGGRVSRAEIRAEWRRILTALFELADRLNADVGDTGIGRTLDPDAFEAELDRYAGEVDEPLPEPATPMYAPPKWPVPDFEAMSEDERRRYLAELRSGRDAGILRLRRAAEARGGPELDLTPESLLPLWPWLLEVGTTADPPLEDRSDAPMWVFELGRELSLETLWLLDGLIHYVAEVILRNVPGTRWGIGRGVHDSAIVGKPVLEYADSEFSPVGALLVLLHSALHDPDFPRGAPRGAPDTLYRLFEDVRAAHERGLRFPP